MNRLYKCIESEDQLKRKRLSSFNTLFSGLMLLAVTYQWVLLERKVDLYDHEINQAIVRDEAQNSKNEKFTEVLKFLLANKPVEKATTPSPVSEIIGFTNGPKANLRSAPSTDSEILMVLTGENKLLIEGEEGSFYKVTAPSGEKAYVAKSLVNVPVDIG